MGIFDRLFGKKGASNPVSTPVQPVKKDTVLRLDRSLYSEEYMWRGLSKFRCKDGIVYLHKSGTGVAAADDYKYGTYKKIDEDKWVVYFEDCEVARIEPSLSEGYFYIVFTCSGIFNEKKAWYIEHGFKELADRMKCPFDWCAAQCGSAIRDFETGKIVGFFEGDKVEAAAAFAVAAYDFMPDTKYEDYFTSNYRSW